MNQEKIKAYYQMWSEAWTMFRSWATDYKNCDSFWSRIIDDGEAFIKKHNGTQCARLAKQIVLEMIDEFMQLARNERIN